MSAQDAMLATAHAETEAEITRTDTKTGLLLAFVGAVVAGSWTGAKAMPLNLAACIVGGLGTALSVAAADLLLRSVRPNIGGRHGFPLSRIAVATFTGLKRAVDLTCAGGALLIVAALVTAEGRHEHARRSPDARSRGAAADPP
ncbi:integral membrane plasmid transfer protein [Streptomyces sp. NPDC051954]|uniref:integral membrane plasmid transfer protein n=1 Tax=unclassified Streptomyces TaxID=2593676 RepID=UPI00342185FC